MLDLLYGNADHPRVIEGLSNMLKLCVHQTSNFRDIKILFLEISV